MRERASLDNKLAKVNGDNESFKKKVEIMERALNRGESLYKEREEDVRVLKLEVKRLRQEEANLHKTTQNMEEMKKEVLQLQKDLLQEKTKVKSLQTELENPMNIHRWRKLEGKGKWLTYYSAVARALSYACWLASSNTLKMQ